MGTAVESNETNKLQRVEINEANLTDSIANLKCVCSSLLIDC